MSTSSENKREISQILKVLEDRDTNVVVDDPLENYMVLNMGPQHPATHGVLRLLVKLEGETVVDCIPEMGYLHRGYEKIAEASTYMEFIPHTDRLDYISPIANNVAIALAIEKLAGIEAPPRAQYIRVIGAELARISSHLMAIGAMAMDVGAMTVFLWAFREREKLYDVFDLLTGVRFTTSYTRIGGVAQDMTDETKAAIEKFIDEFPIHHHEIEKMLNRNRIFLDRTVGVGVINGETGLEVGLTGATLRASGVEHDIRTFSPYLVYDLLSFDVITENDGDCFARYMVRMREMLESVKIVRQALDKIPQGPIKADMPKKVLPKKERVYTKMEELIHDFVLVNDGINPEPGEIYSAIEGSKGELGFYIKSNGSGRPWRLKIRSPSFCNLQALPLIVKGQMISDVVAIIGSIDPIMGEADK
ncbi:MAG: NADH dehydrogenase (quinone) subunit D [Bacteroidetes bacterium]|jgi:NADH-quinone oxidoreductase subunit D|nr:NADH dehydrogenase (quinone) subunit D [Bacteroidota bacterium]MCL5034069.1 NADH dehydrogenase (quinone) subunit D [Bacteroidota bacterium]